MQLNNINLNDRNNRPTVLTKVGLRAFFINDGLFQDPYEISGVTILNRSDNLTPNSIFDHNVITSALTPDQILMHYKGVKGSSLYSGAITDVSSIYRIGSGDYVCVLDGEFGNRVSGLYDFYGSSLVVPQSVSATGEYIDVWTVKFTSDSNYVSIVNNFQLFDDTFVVLTEPISFQVYTKLVTKHIRLGSIENLKFTSDITIDNRDIDNSIKNIFKDSTVLSNIKIKIEKINEDTTTLPSKVTVVDFVEVGATSGLKITSDNTILYRFNTTTLSSHPDIADFGGVTGTYKATLKYTVFDETIISPPYYFTIS